jgi:hypothetical protein
MALHLIWSLPEKLFFTWTENLNYNNGFSEQNKIVSILLKLSELKILFCAIVLYLVVYHVCFQDGKLTINSMVSNFWCSRTVSKVYSKLIDYYNNFYVDGS